MKILSIRLFLSLLITVIVVGCTDIDSGFLSKTTKQPEVVADTPEAVQKHFEQVTASRLNLRENSSSKAKILAVLNRGESVEVLTEKGGWAEVKTDSSLLGWVASSYLTGFKKEQSTSSGEVHKEALKNDKLVEENTKVINLTGTDLGAPGSGEVNFGAMPRSDKKLALKPGVKIGETLKAPFPLRIYEKDSAQSPILFLTEKAEPLQVVDENDHWSKVKRLSGKIGWLYYPNPVEMDRFNSLIKVGNVKKVEEYLDNGMPLYMVYGTNIHHALHIALMTGRQQVAELLIKRGADVNVRDSLNNTPLHAIAQYCARTDADLVQQLIDAGANVNAKGRAERTGYEWTALSNVEMQLNSLKQGTKDWEICYQIKKLLMAASMAEKPVVVLEKDGEFESTDSSGKVHTQTFKNEKRVEQEAKVVDLTGTDLGAPGSGQAISVFHVNEEIIKLIDSIAYLQDEGDPAKPATVIAFTDYVMNHKAVVDEIDPLTSLYDQSISNKGNMVILSLVSPERGRIFAFLSKTSEHITLDSDFSVKMENIDTSHVTGVCFSNNPRTIFDDTYEVRLSFDLPVTPITRPSLLGPDGGEPGEALLALFQSIPSKNWDVASLHLPKNFLPSQKPKDLDSFFHGLELNFPSEASITEGQIKGNHARLKIKGKDYEGKKIKGKFDLNKEQKGWRIKNFGLFFDRE